MGQAKQRGTYEERKAIAIARNEAAHKAYQEYQTQTIAKLKAERDAKQAANPDTLVLGVGV